MDDLVCINTYATRVDADLVKSRLEASGIEAVVTADDGGGMYSWPFSGTFGKAKLFVQVKNVKKARNLLTEKLKTQTPNKRTP